MDGFLKGFRILDLTDVKGHLGGRILGDMGADVIKIEPPGGDPSRNTGPFYQNEPDPERSLSWFYANANKRGITLDLNTPRGKRIFAQLTERTDLILESYAPGHMAKLGLGYSSLSGITPDIILASLSPFGQDGPYKDFETSDLVSSALGGLVFVFGDADRPPVRISSPQAFFIGAQHAAVGAISAIYHRELTGEGQWVDVSMQEAIVQSLTYLLQGCDQLKAFGLRSGSDTRPRPRPEPLGELRMQWMFACRDGYVFLAVQGGAAAPVKSGRSIVAWANEEGYALKIRDYPWESWDLSTVEQDQQDLLQDQLAPFLATKTKTELLEQAAKRRILLAPVNSVSDLPGNPQLLHRNYWQDVFHPEMDTELKYPGPSVKVDSYPQRIRLRAPTIGEHNSEIYETELGFSAEELRQLRIAGVV